MIGFWLVNLLPPIIPQTFNLRTSAGTWTLTKAPNFDDVSQGVTQGGCAVTYSIEFDLPTDASRSSLKDAALLELLPICLAASFATGMAVTIRHNLPASEVLCVQIGPHFPRERGISGPNLCVTTLDQLIQFIEKFVTMYPALEGNEKLRLLLHFYIDALSCWSLENLYLSGSTLLQIIASTEENSGRIFAPAHATQRNLPRPAFFDYLAGAADRVRIPPLNHDVVKIRNSLIHKGTLKTQSFSSQADAAIPIAEAMAWVDSYLYAVLQMGPVPRQRHFAADYERAINSFSF